MVRDNAISAVVLLGYENEDAARDRERRRFDVGEDGYIWGSCMYILCTLLAANAITFLIYCPSALGHTLVKTLVGTGCVMDD